MNAPYIVYCDGACSGNPGPGGWAWVSLADGEIQEGYGGEPVTTNNRMELIGAIEGLEAIRARVESGKLRQGMVEVRTDSQYVKNGVTTWIASWKRNGWRTADRKPVKNGDLWMELIEAARPHKIEWKWVKGHAGHDGNERCDALANAAIAAMRAA